VTCAAVQQLCSSCDAYGHLLMNSTDAGKQVLEIDADSLRLPDQQDSWRLANILSQGGLRRYSRFVSAMPMEWAEQACRLLGKAFHVAVAIWDLHSLKKSAKVALAHKHLSIFSVGRFAAYRALKCLETAGMISVERKPGRAPVVTIDSRYLG
jgi:hypothetical protein